MAQAKKAKSSSSSLRITDGRPVQSFRQRLAFPIRGRICLAARLGQESGPAPRLVSIQTSMRLAAKMSRCPSHANTSARIAFTVMSRVAAVFKSVGGASGAVRLFRGTARILRNGLLFHHFPSRHKTSPDPIDQRPGEP
jgi:hypothetical protein